VLEVLPPTRPQDIDDQHQIRGTIPIRNPDFTGREDLLFQLRTALETSSKAAVLPRALHGLGGVGKTQLALEYVYRYSHEYDLIWWVPAEQLSLALSSLVALCEALGLPVNADQKQTAETVVRHLNVSRLRWLLVFDNADEPADIVPLVPSTGGHVIITSRNQDWANASDPIEVNVFTRPESVALLRRRSAAIADADADRLAATLGDLPLALDQARYWCAATGMTVSEYLSLFEGHVRELLSEGKPPWYPTTIAAFVSLAVERLREARPEVAQLLELFAFLGAEPISVGMLSRAREAALSEPLRPVLRESIPLNRAVRDLRRYGLAKVDPDQRIQVHRLVQMVLREELDEGRTKQSLENVQRIFAAANPAQPEYVSRYGVVYREIGPHVLAADLVNSDVYGARQVVLDQIRFLYVTGDYEGSRRLGETAVAAWSAATGARVGPDGELTLIATRHLANALRDLGEKERARELDADVYERLEQSAEFGPEHEHTLATAMSVAVDLRVAGKYREALKIDELSVERHTTVFGVEDELTLRARSNSAVNLRMLGDFAGALAIDEELVQERLATVGEEDPRYMFCVMNRALDLNGRGRYAEALDSLRRIYPRYRATLGPRHNFVLVAARALGVSLRKTGRHAEAVAWSRENYYERDARFGPDHEHTLASAMSHANALRTSGELGVARSLAAESVERYGRVFGERHPLTLVATVNLAIILRALAETREARRLDEATAEGMRTALGAEHGYTLCVINNLANDLVLAHDLDGARQLSVSTLETSRRVRGERHPYTLACATNTALDMLVAGDEAEGQALLDSTVGAFADVLGPDHPETIDARRFKRAECDIEPPPT
jgi:tetratricopeptide (TPR) repeat protein